MAKPEWEEPWDTAKVAWYLQVQPGSLRRMRMRKGFMPEPDGFIGRSPWWWASTILAWAEDRPQRGWQGHKSKKFGVSA